MIAWTLLIFIALEFVVFKSLLWSVPNLEKYLLLRNNDDWVHNAFTIQKIKRYARENPDEKLLIYLGGSGSLESISSDENMETKLSNVLEKNISFFSITSSYMTFAETTMIISELGSINDIYLISVAPYYLMKQPQIQIAHDERTYLRYFFLPVPAKVRNLLTEYELNFGPFYIFRTFRSIFAITHQIKYNINNKVLHAEYDRHAAPNKVPVNDSREERRKIDRVLWQMDLFADMNFKLLELTIDTAKNHRASTMLLRMPLAPVKYEKIRQAEEGLDEYLVPLLKAGAIDYIDLRDKAPWKKEDFMDYEHMRSIGRKKFENALSDELKHYFESNDGGKR